METYRLARQPAVGDEQPAVAYDLFQPDAQGDLQLVDSITWTDPALIADPAGDPEVKYWQSSLADGTKAWKIVPRTALGLNRGDELVHGARPANPGMFAIEAWTADAGLGIVEGIKFIARPVGGSQASAGDWTVVEKYETASAATGKVRLEIPADAGQFELVLGNKNKPIDTTGRDGTVVRWKDI